MKHLTTAVCMAVLMATPVAAQMPPMDKGKMPMGQTDKSKMDKSKMGKAITVTGCVAGTDGGHFMLTNGMMTGETTGKSYDLMGGNLKGHIGHKVAVTGTTMESGMAGKGKMAGKPKMEKDEMGEHKMAKDKMATAPHRALHVTSVKMIAATCP